MFGLFKKKAQKLISDQSDSTFEIVGESFYQTQLLQLAGGEKTEDGFELRGNATVVPEPDNPKDRHAAAVYLEGYKVGYLARHDTTKFHNTLRDYGANYMECKALLVGGWKRGRDEGHFGVKLLTDLPPRGRAV